MKIPVIILSGFLGSGKTTLLLSLLKESKRRGLNPGVIMNELGAKDVDGYILQESTGTSVEKLLDGCICCSRKEELPRSLTALLVRRPDIIYIELTGVADPDEIAKSLLAPAAGRPAAAAPRHYAAGCRECAGIQQPLLVRQAARPHPA